MFMFGGGARSWACNKQRCVFRSIIEAKFVASNLALTEAV